MSNFLKNVWLFVANYDIIEPGVIFLKLTVSKSKNSASFFVQKTIRKNGKPTTITIEKLGNLETVRARANGEDPYRWAQAYVDELNRKEYEEKKSIIISCSPTKLLKKGEQHSFNCGYLFLQQIYYDLGLHNICKKICERHHFSYDLNDILSKLVYSRILFPASKLSTNVLAKKFLEQPTFELHDIYRALSVLAEENDFIQAQLYKNSTGLSPRKSGILYYDCTNYYFEIEEEDALRKYGHSKQHQPLPIVGMGLFMDYDGIPLAFSIFPGNQNEQPTMKPLEQKIIQEFGCDHLVVCTDAGLSSATNRRFNNLELNKVQMRSFITTQSIKKLPEETRNFALNPEGWKLPGSDKTYCLSDLTVEKDYDKIFYKETTMVEELSRADTEKGVKPLEQRLIVSFSLKYKLYQEKIRNDQIQRAVQIINAGGKKRKAKNENDPNRFIDEVCTTSDGEVCAHKTLCLSQATIDNEAIYDGFYAVCTNLEDQTEDIVTVNKKRWEIEECFRIMKTEFKARPVYLQKEDRIKAHFLTCFLSLVVYRYLEKKLCESFTCESIIQTLREMNMVTPGEKLGYMPAYTRTDLTDKLHETAGFRTDYEITTDMNIKRIIAKTKSKKEKSR